MDDDFSFVSPVKRPVQPPKAKVSIPRIESDKLQAEKDLRGAPSECPVCKKNLKELSMMRRSAHVNKCIDANKDKEVLEKAKLDALASFQCPLCSEVITRGPYLIAHAGKCSRTFDVPVADMIKVLETASAVATKKRQLGINKEMPVTTEMIVRAKKSMDETMSSSNAGKDDKSETPKTEKPREKRYGGLLRSTLGSTVFSKKEPVGCRCNGLHKIQQRFCEQFKGIKKRTKFGGTKSVEKKLIRQRNKKMNNLTRLVDDLRKSLTAIPTDVKLKSKEDKVVGAHYFMLKARTKLTIPAEKVVDLTRFSTFAIEYYVNYVYTASMDWTRTTESEIRTLAEEFGPIELAAYFLEAETLDSEEDDDVGSQKSVDLNAAFQGECFLMDTAIEAGEDSASKLDAVLANQRFTLSPEGEVQPVAGREQENEVEMDCLTQVKESAVNVADVVKTGKSPAVSKLNREIDVVTLDDTVVDVSANPDSFADECIKSPCRSPFNLHQSPLNSPFHVLSPINTTPTSTRKRKSRSFGANSPLTKKAFIRTPSSHFPSSSVRRSAKERSPSIEVISCIIKGPRKPPIASPAMDKSRDLFESSTPKASFVEEPWAPMSPLPVRSPVLATRTPREQESPPFISSPVQIHPRQVHPPLKKRSVPVLLKPPTPEHDSFLDDISFGSLHPRIDRNEPSTPADKLLSNLSEASRKQKIINRLGSGVKIVKTSNVTPMPSFEAWTDVQIRQTCASYGLRSDKARKTLIKELKKVYESSHPVVDLGASTPKRTVPARVEVVAAAAEAVRLDFEEENNSSDGNLSQRSILNESTDELMEESCVFDDDPIKQASPTKSKKLISDVSAAKPVFLAWLKLAQNEELYNHVLSMQPVIWNDLVNLIACSDHDVRRITKKILADVLDALNITFSLPDVKWKKGKGFKSG